MCVLCTERLIPRNILEVQSHGKTYLDNRAITDSTP